MNFQRHIKTVRTKTRLSGLTAAGITVLVMAVVLVVMITTSNVYSESKSAQYKEYEVKAAFMYNFLKFVNWPKEKSAQDNNQIIIGIIGEDPFGSAADVFKGKTIEDHQVAIKYFDNARQLKESSEKAQEIAKCYLLFICASEQKNVKDIIDVVSQRGVLTVGDSEKFIESGVIINFMLEDNKIRFDINLDSSEKAGLEIRSQLLRLARKVIKGGSNVTVSADNPDKQKGK
jgi:hypothetical protein